MTEQYIIWFHVFMFFWSMFMAYIWSAESLRDALIKMVHTTVFFTNAAILATWLGWIKVV